jgi:tRNA(Ile)-lysidine synthase
MTATGAGFAAANSPPPELVSRFTEALERLSPEGGRLGLAVSGGPDSLAMLLLAEATIPGRFEVAAVDHGLRAEAADECAMVAELCAARGLRCSVLRVSVETGNLQAKARDARYAALAIWAEQRGLGAVATAHHADDQVETLLMRLNRGSGIAGLAGVRERGLVPESELPLIRPLLGFSRAELASVVARAGLIPVADPSNADDRFDRVRVRKALGSSNWLDPAGLAASAGHIAEADAALEWTATREWGEQVSVRDNEIRYRPRAPRAVAMRVAARAIATLGGPPRGADLARLIDRLQAGGGGNLAGVLVTAEHADWVFRAEPPRRSS